MERTLLQQVDHTISVAERHAKNQADAYRMLGEERRKVSRLEAEARHLKGSADSFKEMLEAERKQCQALRDQLPYRPTPVEKSLQQALEKKQAEADHLQVGQDKQRETIARLENQVASYEEDRKVRVTEYKRVTTRIANLTKEVENLETKVRNRNRKIKRLTSEGLGAENVKLRNKLTVVNAETVNLNKSIEGLKKSLGQFKKLEIEEAEITNPIFGGKQINKITYRGMLRELYVREEK